VSACRAENDGSIPFTRSKFLDMVIFTDIKTGEKIVLPTPDDKEVVIDALPSKPLTKKETKKWFEFHNKKRGNTWQRTTPPRKK
jgi:hypothetical protein